MSDGYSKWLQKPRAVWGKIPMHLVDDIEELRNIQSGFTDEFRDIYDKLIKDNNLDPTAYHPEIYIQQDGDDFVSDKTTVIIQATPNDIS